MANPFAPYEVMTPDNGVVDLSIEFPVGATGAVGTLTGGREMGTPLRNGVGDYSFPLSQGWQKLRNVVATVVGAHSANTSGKYYEVIADSVTSTSAPLVRLQFVRGDGTAAEIANGDILKVTFSLTYKTP
jgi:hypothetical protein